MNMKKLFPENQEPKKGILEFLDKKGFYIVLILCIVIVAGTAFFVTSQKASSDKLGYDAERIIPEDIENESAADVAGNVNAQTQAQNGNVASAQDNKVGALDVAQAATKSDAAVKPAATDSSKITPIPAKPKVVKPVTKAATTKKAAATATKIEFEMPVIGEVTFDYAVEKLAYSKTLEEWRAHEGIDLAADRGSNVKAAADGVVSEVKNDPRFGIVVILEHKNGLKTVYANLASDDMVSPNQKVKKGDIIGCVGNTAAFEASEQSHLHFEVLKNNENVSPASYIPVKQVKN